MCVCVCVVVGVDGCMPLSMCICRCVYVGVCVVCCWWAVNRYIPLTILVDVDACPCCHLLMFVRIPLFKTPSMLLSLVNKESE